MNCLFWASLCLLAENLYRASRMGWLRILRQLEKQDHQGKKLQSRPTQLGLSWRTKLGFLGQRLGSFGIKESMKKHAE